MIDTIDNYNSDCGCSDNNSNLDFNLSAGDCSSSGNSVVTWNDIQDKPSCFPSCDSYIVGEVKTIAHNNIPTGWLACNGQILSRTLYAALFAAIGTTYNTGGESPTEFRIPDCRGRGIMHQGQGSGLTNRTLGQLIGAESNTQGHTHTGTTQDGGPSAPEISLSLDNSLGLYVPSGTVGINGNTGSSLSNITPTGTISEKALTVDFGNTLQHEDTIAEDIGGHKHDIILPGQRITVEGATDHVPAGSYETEATQVQIDLSTQPLEHSGTQDISHDHEFSGTVVNLAHTHSVNLTGNLTGNSANFSHTHDGSVDITLASLEHSHDFTTNNTNITVPTVSPFLIMTTIIKY